MTFADFFHHRFVPLAKAWKHVGGRMHLDDIAPGSPVRRNPGSPRTRAMYAVVTTLRRGPAIKYMQFDARKPGTLSLSRESGPG
jgi:hypothetical protein